MTSNPKTTGIFGESYLALHYFVNNDKFHHNYNCLVLFDFLLFLTRCLSQRGVTLFESCQEDQLGALGLVTNAVILWNTIYIQASLEHLRQQLFEIKEDDEARLSPLLHSHINMLGQYSFTLAKNVMKGSLRPLNQSFGMF